MIGNLVLALGVALASGSALYEPPHRAVVMSDEWYSDTQTLYYQYTFRENSVFKIDANVISNAINFYSVAPTSNEYLLYYQLGTGFDTLEDFDADFEIFSWLNENLPLFALRVFKSNLTFEIYPYWKVHNYATFGLNSTCAFYWQDDENYQNNIYKFFVGGREFVIDSYDFYQISENYNFYGGFARQEPQTIDYSNSYVYYGGSFHLSVTAQTLQYMPTLDLYFGSTRYASDDYIQGYLDGYDDGSLDGYTEGKNMGESIGYQNGYADGLATASGRNSSWLGLMSSVADTPIRFLKQIFSFELFGMNVAVVILSCLTAIIIFGIVKKVWKR